MEPSEIDTVFPVGRTEPTPEVIAIWYEHKTAVQALFPPPVECANLCFPELPLE